MNMIGNKQYHIQFVLSLCTTGKGQLLLRLLQRTYIACQCKKLLIRWIGYVTYYENKRVVEVTEDYINQ